MKKYVLKKMVIFLYLMHGNTFCMMSNVVKKSKRTYELRLLSSTNIQKHQFDDSSAEVRANLALLAELEMCADILIANQRKNIWFHPQVISRCAENVAVCRKSSKTSQNNKQHPHSLCVAMTADRIACAREAQVCVALKSSGTLLLDIDKKNEIPFSLEDYFLFEWVKRIYNDEQLYNNEEKVLRELKALQKRTGSCNSKDDNSEFLKNYLSATLHREHQAHLAILCIKILASKHKDEDGKSIPIPLSAFQGNKYELKSFLKEWRYKAIQFHGWDQFMEKIIE